MNDNGSVDDIPEPPIESDTFRRSVRREEPSEHSIQGLSERESLESSESAPIISEEYQ